MEVVSMFRLDLDVAETLREATVVGSIYHQSGLG